MHKNNFASNFRPGKNLPSSSSRASTWAQPSSVRLQAVRVTKSAPVTTKPSPRSWTEQRCGALWVVGRRPRPQPRPWAETGQSSSDGHRGQLDSPSGQLGCQYWTPEVLLDPSPLWSPLSLRVKNIPQSLTLLSPKAMLSSGFQQREVTPKQF